MTSMPTTFDANCRLGRRTKHTPLAIPITADDLLQEMDRVGIAQALVFHAMAMDGHPSTGNAQLMREIDGYARLHPCWVLMPDTGETPPPVEMVAQMKARGVRAARMCPAAHRFPFTDSVVGSVLKQLEAARIPLLVDFDVTHWSQPIDWASLNEICGLYPELSVIVARGSVSAPRSLFPYWHQHPNLYLETSYYQVVQGLSEVVDRFGAKRLVFGSGLPDFDAALPLTQLRYDFLSTEDRAKIAGDTLEDLLAGAHGGAGSSGAGSGKANSNGTVEAVAVPSSLPGSVSATARATGTLAESDVTELPLHPIIDAHAHLGPWFATYTHAGDAAGLVRNMDRMGIQSTAIIAFDAIGPDMRGGNSQVAEAMRQYPGRFLGYATVDPNEPRAMAGELERCFDELGFHAIKFHCETHGYPANSDNYRPALEYADAHELAVLIHGEITERMLISYPRAQFLAAHVGGWSGRPPHYAVELARDFPNIHMELCSSIAYNLAMEKLVEEVGADRVVHGSDTPLMDAGYQLGRVLGARLDTKDKEKILYRNAVRLFHLETPELQSVGVAPAGARLNGAAAVNGGY